jgi:hypothetical protein
MLMTAAPDRKEKVSSSRWSFKLERWSVLEEEGVTEKASNIAWRELIEDKSVWNNLRSVRDFVVFALDDQNLLDLFNLSSVDWDKDDGFSFFDWPDI